MSTAIDRHLTTLRAMADSVEGLVITAPYMGSDRTVLEVSYRGAAVSLAQTGAVESVLYAGVKAMAELCEGLGLSWTELQEVRDQAAMATMMEATIWADGE